MKHKPGSEDNFRNKGKTKKGNEKVSKAQTQSFVCESTDCQMENMDLIKCYRCDKWVCENCHNINVAQLKSLLTKCNSVYFLCNDYNSKSMCVVGDIPNSDSSESLTNISNQLSNIEQRLNKKITTKLKDVMDQVETQVNKILHQGQSYVDMVTKNLSPDDSKTPIPRREREQENANKRTRTREREQENCEQENANKRTRTRERER